MASRVSVIHGDFRLVNYGSNNGYELLRECQLRVIDELLNDGPTFDFRASAVPTPSA